MTTNFTKFGVVAGVSPDIQAFVVSSINQATQDLITQQGTAQIGAVPQYTNTSGKTVLATPYTLPTTVGIDGQSLVVSGGNLVYGAGGGPTPTFLTELTVQNLAQGTSALNKNYIFPTSLPITDGQTYALTGTNLGSGSVPGISVVFGQYSFTVQAGVETYSFAFDILAGVYSITEFIRTFQLLFDEQVGRFPNVTFRAILVCDTVAVNPRFAWDVAGISPNFVRLQSLNATNGHQILGGLPFDQGFDPGLSPYPLLSVTYLFSFPSNNLLEWTKINPAVGSAILSNDRSSSVVCSDVGIGGSVITAQGNWNFELGNLNNVGSISSTAETLTSTCGQSQLQLASIADGTGPSTTTYLSSGSGSTNTAFATTVDEASIVRDGGTGTVLRVTVGAETILKNALDRECVRVYDYGVQLKGEGQPLATGVRCSLNMDGDIFFNREDPIFGLKEIFLTQGSHTRIWSPSTASEVDIDESYFRIQRSTIEKLRVDDTGTLVNQAYYLPTADGSNLQVMTTNGHGIAAWQTPIAANPFNQSLNTADNVAFNNVSTNLVDSFNTLELGKTNALGVNIGKVGITTNIKGTTQINSAYTLPTTAGTTGQVLTRNSGTSSVWASPQILGFYSQTSPVTVVSTAVQTSIIGAGVGSLTVPANYFTTGMGFTYRTGGLFGALNNATIRFRLTNSGTLFDSGLLQFSPAVASGRPWNCDVTFIYIGGTTMITNFNFQYNNNADARGFTAQNTNSTFNPTIINTLGFTAQWGASSASNTITTNYGILTKIY